MLPAVKAGLIQEAEVNAALRRLLAARFKLGMFDPPAMVKYAQIPYSVNDSPAHRQLALETARKSIVLLKNEEQDAAAEQIAEDHRRDRPRCRRCGCAAGQL